MKKVFIRVAQVVGIIVLLLAVAKIFNLYTFGRMAGQSMWPTLVEGQYYFGFYPNNVDKDDIVIYKSELDLTRPYRSQVHVARVVGVEGDKVEVRRGSLYINGSFVDDTLHFGYFFRVSKDDMTQLLATDVKRLRSLDLIVPPDTDSTLLNLTYSDILKLKIPFRRYLWDKDNYGPKIVSKDSLFVLGDNRSNAFDSRHDGLVSKSDVMSKIPSKPKSGFFH